VKFGDVKEEAESAIVAAQDQAISADYFKNKILKEESDRNADYENNIKKLLTT
jgi:hypothetical protein